MELLTKLLRAHVWLSQRVLCAQDGFLVVTRVAGHETLAYGSLDDDVQGDAKRKYRSVALKWAEREERDITNALQLLHDEAPPKLEFLLFMLQAPANVSGKASNRKQHIVYIGKSVLRLSTRDVDAMRTQHELVFTTVLDGGLGSLDVKLKKSRMGGDKQLSPENGDAEPDANDTRGSFNVNWSSSEALKKDLDEKARLKAEGEKKLLLQLRKIVAKALHATKLRNKELRRQRLWWAAANIQRAYRALLSRRHEARERTRREQLALQDAKKVRVKEKVVERNLKQAQAMREQLRGFKSGRSCYADINNKSHKDHINSSNNIVHVDQSHFAQIKAEKQSIELAKLQHRLAILEAKRAEALAHNQKRPSERGPEVSSRHHERTRQQSLLTTTNQQQHAALTTHRAPQRDDVLLDADLVRAIHTLHFAQKRKW